MSHVARPTSSSKRESGVSKGPVITSNITHRGKTPPVDPFTAEDSNATFDDWLPTLEKAAKWNEWTWGKL